MTKKSRKAQSAGQTHAIVEFSPTALLVLVGLLASICYSGLQVVNAAQDTRMLYQQLGEVQKQQDALLEQNSRLSLERSSLSSLQKIEQVAELELDMEFPVEVQGVQP